MTTMLHMYLISLPGGCQVRQKATSAQRQHKSGQKHERKLRHKISREPSKERHGQQRLCVELRYAFSEGRQTGGVKTVTE